MSAQDDLASWDPFVILLAGFGLIVVALAVAGRRAVRAGLADDAAADAGWLGWVPIGLERATGFAGWAAGMIGTAAFGLLMAGMGFYNDVAWHVGLGRDKELFTAPHSMIVAGLGFIALGAAVGIVLATVQHIDTPLRFKSLRIPWSAVPLALLGLCALAGFPLDDLWHASYGIDVTMWSPTHLLMICGACFSLIAAWLVLSEAGVGFRDSVRTRVVHFLAAWFVLAGLTAPLGEFNFGVPQFQQLYHPVLLALASGFAFTATRLVLGRGWSIALALASFVPTALDSGASEFVPTRAPGSFVASAIAVELVAAIVGTDRRLRFAALAGFGVGTIGLAGDWLWNADAIQPWRTPLLPGALVVGTLAAVGAAVLGTTWGGAVARQPGRVPTLAVAAGAVAVLVALLIPLRRSGGAVDAALVIDRRGDEAAVTVTFDPPDAAEDAKWLQVIAWQGGGFEVSELDRIGDGVYRAEESIPVGGRWKTLLRLHRGDQLLAAPVFLPDDPEIGADEIPAVDRTVAMTTEQRFLLREQKPGPATMQVVAYTVIALVSLAWAGSFVLAASRIPRRPPLTRDSGTRGDQVEPALSR